MGFLAQFRFSEKIPLRMAEKGQFRISEKTLAVSEKELFSLSMARLPLRLS